MAVFDIAVGDLGTRSPQTGTNPCVVPVPSAGIQVGDLIVIQVATTIDAGAFNNPSGFSVVQDGTVPNSTTCRVLSKVATSDDAAASSFSFTVGGSTTNYAAGRCIRIRRQAVSSPIAASNEGNANNSTAVSVASITPAAEASLFLFFVFAHTIVKLDQ
jgi:hypothetical protein